jgi:hypothetical protein
MSDKDIEHSYLRLVQDESDVPYIPRVPKWLHAQRTKENQNDPLYVALPTWAKSIYATSKKNAGIRKIDFDLSPQQFAKIVGRADGRCELSGIEFNFSKGEYARRPFVASLDRIDSAKGYTFKNCRLILLIINLGMNEWGLDQFMLVAERLVFNKKMNTTVKSTPDPVVITEVEQIIEKPEGFLTAREFLEMHGQPELASTVASAATKWCRHHQIDFITCEVPAYQRVDGTWYHIPTKAYPREALDSVWQIATRKKL